MPCGAPRREAMAVAAESVPLMACRNVVAMTACWLVMAMAAEPK